MSEPIAGVLARIKTGNPESWDEFQDDLTRLLAIAEGVVAKEQEWRTSPADKEARSGMETLVALDRAKTRCADELAALLRGDGMLVVENRNFTILSADDACCELYEYDVDSNTTYCKKHMIYRNAPTHTWWMMAEIIERKKAELREGRDG